MNLTVQFECTGKDHREARDALNQLAQGNLPTRRPGFLSARIGWGYLVLPVVLVILAYIVQDAPGLRRGRTDLSTVLVMTLVAVVIGLAVASVRFRKRMLDRRVVQECIVQIDDNGIAIDNGTGPQRMLWSALLAFAETSNLLLLVHAEFSGDFIPKRAITDPFELAELQSFLSRTIVATTGGFEVIPMAQLANPAAHDAAKETGS